MIVECQKCGAPLAVLEGQRLVQCAYCGATSQVAAARVAPPPSSHQPPGRYQPPGPPWQPPPPPARSGCAGAAVGVTVALVVLGGVAGALVAGRRSPFARRVDPDAAPTGGVVALGAAGASRDLAGVAGGPVLASTLGSQCRGYYPVAPQYSLRLSAPQRVRLTTAGGDDLTMAVREPSGAFRCDDDGGQGSNPLLELDLAPGVYPVWVGAYHQNRSARFSLDLQAGAVGALPLAGGLAVGAAPTLGAFALSGPATVMTRAGTAGGPLDAHALGSNCRGHVPSAPHLVLTTADYRRVVLVTGAASDLTMVVRDASGALHCDDDSGGSMQPRVEATLAPGRYEVRVGTYHAGGRVPFTLSVQSSTAGALAPASALLSPGSPPTVAVLDLDRAAATTALRGSVVGTLAAREVSAGCTGYLTAPPQLRLVTRTPRRVSITATSRADLTMLARGPRGDVLCADDSRGGRDPTIEADIAAGETTVWVGTFGPASRAPFRVEVAVAPAPAPVPGPVK